MTGLTTSHAFALSIFASYFLLIFLLFYIIISSIRDNSKSGRNVQHAFVFGGLTLASFAHTWFWMLRFMAWSFHTYEATLEQRESRLVLRIASWLSDTGLFEQAWSVVCASPINWWWSEQLCLFTAGAFTVFLYLQRERVPHLWAYMLLGQLVAISVAWSLLNLALVLIPRPPTASKTRNMPLPLSLTIPVLLSLFTISLSPYAAAATFLPNLLTMHALLILPLLPIPEISSPSLSPRTTSFYTLISIISLLLRVRTALAVLTALHITSSPFFSWRYPADVAMALWTAPDAIYVQAWKALHTHPAQASIGWDVVWTSTVWLAWGLLMSEGTRWTTTQTVKLALQGAFTSVGVVAPLQFGRALRENKGLARDIKSE